MVDSDLDQTYWHITFGTYGTRLHGGRRPTVDRKHNLAGTPFIDTDPQRPASERNRMRGESVLLTGSARALIERTVPALCDRGGWTYVVAAAESEHVHLLCGAQRSIHGKQIRTLVKRWLTQTLNDKLPRPERWPWWADGGSNRPVKNRSYFQNVYSYIEKQRLDR